jgi:hypothetical protein
MTRPYRPRMLATESIVESFRIPSAFELLRNKVIVEVLP